MRQRLRLLSRGRLIVGGLGRARRGGGRLGRVVGRVRAQLVARCSARVEVVDRLAIRRGCREREVAEGREAADARDAVLGDVLERVDGGGGRRPRAPDPEI